VSDHGRAHALLSPSSAERWIPCPASVRMIESLDRADDGGSAYAEEGTRAHTLAEMRAAIAFGLIDQGEHDRRYASWLATAEVHGDDVEEMEGHVATYVSYLQDLAAGMEGPVTVRLEMRVQTGVPGCWGTADAALMSPTRIVVVDFKYGQGVVVRVEGNPQLKLYGVGVLELLDLLGTIETVDVAVCQPRAGGTSLYSMSAKDLRHWRDTDVMDAARETQSPDARFGPGEDSCRWCPAAGICRPRMAYVTQRDFGNPDVMDEDELAQAVKSIPKIRDWCNAVEKEGLFQAYSEGKALPGLKVVMSGGKRSVTDPEAAVERLVEAGFKEEQVARKNVQTLGVLEKVVGKQRLPEVLGDLLRKGDGSPSLVDESDPRDAISPLTEAGKDFQPE
jgi:hypothetical protein